MGIAKFSSNFMDLTVFCSQICMRLHSVGFFHKGVLEFQFFASKG